MLYVFGLVSAFACAWFVLAALQTFADAEPMRMTNIGLALGFGVLAALLFWLARRAQREPTTGATAVSADDSADVRVGGTR